MKIFTLILFTLAGLSLNSCGKAKYGFTGQDNEPKEENQNFTAEQPQGNVTPNEYRGLDGFFLKGTPGTVELGDEVTFTGSCGNKKGELNWTLGDGRNAKGTKFGHKYQRQGTFQIEGVCNYEDGTTQKGTITITVLPKKNVNGQQGGTQQPNQSPGQSPRQCPAYCG